MALSFFWYFLRIFSWMNVHFSTLKNHTIIGGLPLHIPRAGLIGGYGHWPSDDHDHFGGGGGGKWQFHTVGIFPRPHPIELFKFTEDKLAASLKSLNEENSLASEWLDMLQANLYGETSNVETSGDDCACPGACNCATFSPPADVTHFVDVKIWLPHLTQRMYPMRVLTVYCDEQWYWAKIFKLYFGINLKNFILLIDKRQISPTLIVRPEAVVEIIPKGCGGARPKTKVLKSTSHSDYSDEDSDPDQREIIDMPLRWAPQTSSEEEIQEEGDTLPNEEDAIKLLQKYHQENDIADIPVISMKSSDEENQADMQELRKKRKVRRHHALSRQVVAKSLSSGCCKKHKCLSKFTPEEVLEWRKRFWCLTEEQQRQFLLNAFALNTFHDGEKRKYSFEIKGRSVCQEGWFRSLGISNGWFYGLLKEYEEGRVSGESSRRGSTWMSERMRKAILWLKRHIECSGDYMPHENRVCLPSCQSKTELYAIYKEDLALSKVDTVSWSSFKKMWRRHFKHVIIPKQNKFTKCGVCTLIKHSMGKTRDLDKRCSLAVKKKIHLNQQSAERSHYYGNRLKAEMEPQKYLSLILDGMDQAKTNLPHVTSISKSEPSHYLRSHITGAISHGHKRVFAYLDLLQWKHDSNLTLNVLLRIFLELSKEGKLPPYLLLQMDNCYRECKNKFIMAFAAYLVEKEIFKEVHVSFLMVGHTHEDVDQFFSRIAVYLRRKNVMTVPELHEAVLYSFTPRPETHDIDIIYDISGWLGPHIAQIKNHVYPHAFKFFLGADGKAKMMYKNWAQDNNWLPEGDPITLLESQPTGIPRVIRPGLGGKETMKINELIAKVKASSHRMTTEQLSWWRSFINKEKELRQKWDAMTEDEKQKLAEDKWIMKGLRRYQDLLHAPPRSEEEKRQDEEMERLLAKEKRFPPIEVRPKRKKDKEVKSRAKKKPKVVTKPKQRPLTNGNGNAKNRRQATKKATRKRKTVAAAEANDGL